MKIAVVSGGFDPLHTGHINLLESSAAFGDKLVVLVNSDDWLTRKKGRPFMPFEERATIIERMHMVDNVYGVDDKDGSVTEGLIQIRDAFGHDHDYVFVKVVIEHQTTYLRWQLKEFFNLALVEKIKRTVELDIKRMVSTYS